MKKIKFVFGIMLIVLFGLYLYSFEHRSGLIVLSIALLLVFSLTIISFNDSKEKIQNLVPFNLKFTRGLVYCLCSLPILYYLMKRPSNELIKWQVLVYLLVLFFAIFNYGIEVHKNMNK